MKRNLLIVKLFFSILFASLFMILSKIKLTSILGTDMKFSASVFFGPAIASLIGIVPGTLVIVLAHVFGILIRFYKVKDILSYLVFLPIISAGIYFAKMFKGDRKMIIPACIAIILFILHPTGRIVWFYSLFWFIPIFIAFFKNKADTLLTIGAMRIYAYALGSAYIDHCIGSVIYLYFLNIPPKFWIAAIPLTFIERLIIASGIMFSYFSVRITMKALKEIAIPLDTTVEEKKETRYVKHKTKKVLKIIKKHK